MATFPKILSTPQRGQINSKIKLYHMALIVEMMGDKAVPPSILTRLKASGLYRKPRPDVIHRSFLLGKLGIITPELLEMSNRKFTAYLHQKGILLSGEELAAIDLIKSSFSGYLEALGDEFKAKVGSSITKANRKLQRKVRNRLHDKLLLEVERRKAMAAIAKDMAEIAETQLHKAQRIIDTETNNAYQDGRALEIIRKSGDSDPRVFKLPRPGACPECVKAYLETDEKTPKVFLLSELIDNGSNIGKSRANRLATLDSFHPFCSCETHWLPPGFGFNAKGALIYQGRATA